MTRNGMQGRDVVVSFKLGEGDRVELRAFARAEDLNVPQLLRRIVLRALAARKAAGVVDGEEPSSVDAPKRQLEITQDGRIQ